MLDRKMKLETMVNNDGDFVPPGTVGPCGPDDGLTPVGYGAPVAEASFTTALQVPPGQTYPQPAKPNPNDWFDNAAPGMQASYQVASRPTPGQTYDEPAKPNPSDFLENIGFDTSYLV